MERAQVQSLIRELRSQKPRGNTAWVPQLTPQQRPNAASECINVFKEEFGKVDFRVGSGFKMAFISYEYSTCVFFSGFLF